MSGPRLTTPAPSFYNASPAAPPMPVLEVLATVVLAFLLLAAFALWGASFWLHVSAGAG